MGASQVPDTYFCDHSFSKSMAACSSGEGCFPEGVRSVCQLAMNVEIFPVGDFFLFPFERESCLCCCHPYRLVLCSPLECDGFR